MRILLVHREGEASFQFTEALKEGHEIVTCTDKTQIFQIMKNTPCDMVVFSPKSYGYEFSEKGLTGLTDELERQAIFEAMEKTGQNQTQAAKLLKITRGALQYKLKKYDLNSPQQDEKIAA
jgi:transcriptional regulator with GAF, ATPase, and Fis domain